MTVRAGRPGPRALRATLAFCRDDPARCEDALAWYDDGLLVLDGEWISQAGPADALLRDWPVDAPVSDLRGRLILPGFIDSHIHYPQTDIIGAPGGPLLSWLRDYTFPAEQHFADPQHAREVAGFFLDELLRNGTTTALVLGTVHPQSVEVLFEAAELRQLRMLAGKIKGNLPEVEVAGPVKTDGDTTLTCSLSITAGRLRMQHHITVGGDFETRNTGILVQQDGGKELRVAGDVLFDGGDQSEQIGGKASLKAGLLFVAGDFAQTGDVHSFAAEKDHTVVLNGAGPQVVTLQDPDMSNPDEDIPALLGSRFAQLRISEDA